MHRFDALIYTGRSVSFRQNRGANPCPPAAEQLNILLDGAIVTARVVGQVADGGADPGASARLAKDMARRVLDAV